MPKPNLDPNMKVDIQQKRVSMEDECMTYLWSQLVVVWLQHKILILNYTINQQPAITHLLKRQNIISGYNSSKKESNC